MNALKIKLEDIVMQSCILRFASALVKKERESICTFERKIIERK